MSVKISEVFKSIQGEGSTIGRLSIFIRFAGCNLHCSFCDSKFTWFSPTEQNYKEYATPKEFVEAYKNLLIVQDAQNIIFTGGEPTLYQEELIKIVEIIEESRISVFDVVNPNTYEIETNGSVPLNNDFITWAAYERMVQFNISPKLQFDETGVILENINKLEKSTCFYILKFVDDYDEKTRIDILSFLKEASDVMMYPDLKWSDIYVMPECISREEHILNFQKTLDFCNQFNLSFSPRAHILLWDKKRGV